MAAILFVEQFFYPEGWGGAELPRDLAMHLGRSGHKVEVICGADQYAPVIGNAGPDPADAGVRVRRIPKIIGGQIHRAKLVRQVWFYLALMPLLLFRRSPDLFISQTNPPVAVILIAAAARLFRRPLIVIAQDVYPETLFASGLLSRASVIGRLLSGVFGWAYRSAMAVVSLGPVMTGRLIDKGVRPRQIMEISNWATGSPGVKRGGDNPLLSRWGLENRFVLFYSGNMGIGHEFETLIEGFRQALEACPDAVLVFVGRGRRLVEVRRHVRSLRLESSILFFDFLAPDELPYSMGLAHLAIVTLRDGFEGLIAPSKFLGYAARGLPVLYIGPGSDVQYLIERANCGFLLKSGDCRGVCSAIIDAYEDRLGLAARGKAAMHYYGANLTREIAMRKYDRVIAECLTGSARK